MKEEADEEVKSVIKIAKRVKYLKKLIDLRAAETDERQILNATEANKHFSSAFERIDKLERKNRKRHA